MPLTVTYLDDGRGIVASAEGHLTGAELLDVQSGVNLIDHSTRPVLYTFFDFNNVERVDISTPELQRSAEVAICAHAAGAKRRIVAILAGRDFPFALARMWLVFIEATDWDAMVFRDRSVAVAWVRSRVAERFGVEIALA